MSRRTELAACADAELMHLIMAGDEMAMACLFERYSARLVWYAGRFVGSDGDAEDPLSVVLAVFEKIWEGKAKWNGTGKIASFLFAMVRNEALNAKRERVRREARVEYVGFDLPDVAREDDSDAEEAKGGLISRAQGILAGLSERERHLFQRVYVESNRWTSKEIAAELGETPHCIDQALYRLRKKFARIWSELTDGPDP